MRYGWELDITQADKEQWLACLRDPHSVQIFGSFGVWHQGHCAMGWLGSAIPMVDVMGLNDPVVNEIIAMNDETKLDLVDIAAWIEEHVVPTKGNWMYWFKNWRKR